MTPRTALACLALSAACGGSDKPAAPTQNAYTGTVSVSSAAPAGTTTCQGTAQVVRFLAGGGGTDTHAVTVAGGGCIRFVNEDGAPHRPAQRVATAGCAGLDAPNQLGAGGSYTTAPLGAASGPVACDWQDSLNPPGSGGGGGGGY